MSKLTISLPEELAVAVKHAAARQGTSVSGFIAEELQQAARRNDARAAIAEYEAEHGVITEEERESVRRWLRQGGVEWPPSPSTPDR
jgi:hypothetical protein